MREDIILGSISQNHPEIAFIEQTDVMMFGGREDDSMIVTFNDSSLVASINHSGSLENGHYTAYVDDNKSGSWLHCNDKFVVPCPKEELVNTSYLLFYMRN